MNDTKHRCPVCGFPGMDEPARDRQGCATFAICPCCGTEFGYSDATLSHAVLRARWIESGMRWWSHHAPPPAGWDAVSQLRAANLS